MLPLIGAVLLFIATQLMLRGVLDGLYPYGCFMDANTWEEAARAVANGYLSDAAIADRPPLYLFLAAGIQRVTGVSIEHAMFLVSSNF